MRGLAIVARLDGPAKMPKATVGAAPQRLSTQRNERSGLAAAMGAFLMWGLFPLYLHPLAHVPTLQVIAHRIAWCCLMVFGWLAARGEIGSVRAALANPQSRWRLVASALLISVNWLVYVWAVSNGHTVDASLGYFINPLVNVFLGVVLLSERLNRAQWTAVALAGAGVAYLTIATGGIPWIALVLAASFGTYGLIRKVVAVDAVAGLATESLLLLPFAAAWLLWCEQQGTGVLGHSTAAIDALLLGSGLATALPLALFAYGARQIPLSTVGLVQYIGPTLQFLIGVLVFREPFSTTRAIGFVIIWIALAVYVADSLWRNRRALGA
jgi:chloramphenicol-sensitive protein RarD